MKLGRRDVRFGKSARWISVVVGSNQVQVKQMGKQNKYLLASDLALSPQDWVGYRDMMPSCLGFQVGLHYKVAIHYCISGPFHKA